MSDGYVVGAWWWLERLDRRVRLIEERWLDWDAQCAWFCEELKKRDPVTDRPADR